MPFSKETINEKIRQMVGFSFHHDDRPMKNAFALLTEQQQDVDNDSLMHSLAEDIYQALPREEQFIANEQPLWYYVKVYLVLNMFEHAQTNDAEELDADWLITAVDSVLSEYERVAQHEILLAQERQLQADAGGFSHLHFFPLYVLVFCILTHNVSLSLDEYQTKMEASCCPKDFQRQYQTHFGQSGESNEVSYQEAQRLFIIAICQNMHDSMRLEVTTEYAIAIVTWLVIYYSAMRLVESEQPRRIEQALQATLGIFSEGFNEFCDPELMESLKTSYEEALENKGPSLGN